MISVIVPVYNVEKYLRSCVTSIQNQTYRDLEIILVDDGSTDNSGKICDELSLEDKRIKVIHQANGGLAAARNSGLAYALDGGLAKRVDYIAFVDSDDTIDLAMYETLVQLAEKNCADLTICGYQSVLNNDDKRLCNVELDKVQTLNYDQLWTEVFGNLNNSSCNKLYRTALIADLRFPIGIIHGEDLIFNLKYLLKCKSGIKSNCKFYHYYRRSGSITRSEFSLNNLNEIIAKDMAREIVQEHYPAQLFNADKYCFRARMNVLRLIFASKKEIEYCNYVSEYSEYVQSQYDIVKHDLKIKEKIEYYLFDFVRPAYKILTRRR